MSVYYIDGTFVPAEEASLPVSDLVILRGYGVFDFMRTYGGRPFHLDDHLDRLRNSARLIELSCPWSRAELRDIVTRTLAENRFAEANIRLLITGGDSDDQISPGQKPRLLVMVEPLKNFPARWYEEGVKIITANLNRYIPGAKSIDYIRAIVTLKGARAAGAVESVYVDDNDHVLEGTTSNIFAVIDQTLVTPADGILPGITRNVILDLAGPHVDVAVRALSRTELLGADEVFLASSNKEVLPVTAVDDRRVGTGRPGPVTGRVMELFRSYTTGYGSVDDSLPPA